MSYLRRKLDEHGPPLIHTVRGVGYVLRLPRSRGAGAGHVAGGGGPPRG